MEWISVEKRLPEDGQIVAALVEGFEVPVITEFGQQYESPVSWSSATIAVGVWFDEDNVTHWMPLPAPPEDE